MANFDRKIYGESISECKVDSNSPKNNKDSSKRVNSKNRLTIDDNL